MQLFCKDSTVSNNTETSFQKTRETLHDRCRKTRNVRQEDIRQLFPNPRHTKVKGQLETPVISPVIKLQCGLIPRTRFKIRVVQLGFCFHPPHGFHKHQDPSLFNSSSHQRQPFNKQSVPNPPELPECNNLNGHRYYWRYSHRKSTIFRKPQDFAGYN